MSAALAILAALAPAVGLLLLDWVKNKQDPKTVIQDKKDENREAIAKGDAGRLLDERLNRVRPSAGVKP